MRTHEAVTRSPKTPETAVWKLWAGLVAVELGRVLTLLGRHGRSRAVSLIAARLLLCLGLLMQVVLVCLAGYLIDLGISLMELWTELARKHLELTL
jgi:hypothetical protein